MGSRREWLQFRAMADCLSNCGASTTKPGTHSQTRSPNLMFIGPCIIAIVDEWKTNLMTLAILFHLLCAQHVSDINVSIFRSLRLCWWITTSVVLFSVRCVLELLLRLVFGGVRFAGWSLQNEHSLHFMQHLHFFFIYNNIDPFCQQKFFGNGAWGSPEWQGDLPEKWPRSATSTVTLNSPGPNGYLAVIWKVTAGRN